MSTPQQPPCRNLRSNAMYYEGAGQQETDEFSSGSYWCLKTHEAFGPDGEPASKTECCAERSCYLS